MHQKAPSQLIGSPVVRRAVWSAAVGITAALILLPVAAEQAVEHVRFSDRLGTFPVEVSLSHNGVTTIDTGMLGKVYWAQTGPAGFGTVLRSTGPPEAGGTLDSYVDPRFLKVNAQLVGDPSDVAQAYGRELRDRLARRLLWTELLIAGIGAAAALGFNRLGRPVTIGRRRAVPFIAAALCGGLVASGAAAGLLFLRWPGSSTVGQQYPFPEVDGVSFSSPQVLEVARQVRPFIEKNTERISQSAEQFQAASIASLSALLPGHLVDLRPRSGERIVIAEADPQGSIPARRTREVLYQLLVRHLGEDAIALRTISGDITSNGTLAEENYVHDEVSAAGDIPTVAVGGDHDSAATRQQLREAGATVPDLSVEDVGNLKVAGANDPEFKTLFGGSVTNESGVTEQDLGRRLRDEVDPSQPTIVVLHQPTAALAYLGLDSTTALRESLGHETRPWDDGIPDLPPGTVDIGHLHDSDGPWVVWNTDGEEITWTVVDQLGTAGGVEEHPTFNRFSTPFSVPLKAVTVRLQYFDMDTGLETGYATIAVSPDGTAQISDRVDVGLPIGSRAGESPSGAAVNAPATGRHPPA